jgi:TM2 domain-containing membrane protein YozV
LKEKYELAVIEYNRALFFGCKGPDEICIKIANCYLKQNNFTQSVQFFDRAYYSSNSDSIRTEAILGKSFALMMEKDFMNALTELMNLDSSSITYHNDKLNLFKGIAYFGIHEDSLSKKYFCKCVARLNPEFDTAIITEFNEIKRIERRYNPNKAYIFSLILPGSGQFYCGDIKEGINSALLLDGLLIASIFLAKEYSVITSLAMVLPWFQRYYLGGAKKADRITQEKKILKRNEVYQNILKTLEIAYR